MRKQIRGKCPSPLIEKGETWTTTWEKRSAEGGNWNWPTFEKEKLNLLLVPLLRDQNQNHCSFCDGYPLAVTSPETIEHFRPKGSELFPELAFTWDNLFYCCQECQTHKRETFDEALLKPDTDDFKFSKYFIFDFTAGEILPNPVAADSDKNRASKTIEIYGLNKGSRPLHRLQELRRGRSADFPLDHLPYRDFIEAAEAS